MLNCTLSATERTLCCLLETYQTPEGVRCGPAVPRSVRRAPGMPGLQGNTTARGGSAAPALTPAPTAPARWVHPKLAAVLQMGGAAQLCTSPPAPHVPLGRTPAACSRRRAHAHGQREAAWPGQWGTARRALAVLTAPVGAPGSRRCCRSTCPTPRTSSPSGKSSTPRASPCRCEAGCRAPPGRGGGRRCDARLPVHGMAGTSSHLLGVCHCDRPSERRHHRLHPLTVAIHVLKSRWDCVPTGAHIQGLTDTS